MSRQFTDGEISAEIGRIATEGRTLSRTVVRKRLGGGSSTRIDALLKEYRRNVAVTSNGASTGRPPAAAASLRQSPNSFTPQSEALKAAGDTRTKTEPKIDGSDARNIEVIARLQSEIRVLKILLESERKARADDASRHLQTVEALLYEIETYRATPRGRS